MKSTPEKDRQCADAVLMIRPARFGANPETAESNRFQRGSAGTDAPEAARREFDGLVARLRNAGVRVEVAEDTPEPARPDACFPNNWVSFHDDGSVVLYPMMAPSRRAERRVEPVAQLRDAGFRVERTIDLSPWEARGEFSRVAALTPGLPESARETAYFDRPVSSAMIRNVILLIPTIPPSPRTSARSPPGTPRRAATHAISRPAKYASPTNETG